MRAIQSMLVKSQPCVCASGMIHGVEQGWAMVIQRVYGVDAEASL